MKLTIRGVWGKILMGLILLGATALLLFAAAISDLRSRTIPNQLNCIIGLAALPLWLLSDFAPWPDAALQIAAAFGIFLIFFTLFTMGMMGGGDVKMIAAIMLWVPVPMMLPTLAVMAVAGGLLSAGMLIHSKIRKSDARIEVPYGVAIAAAGLWVLHKHYLNQFMINAFA